MILEQRLKISFGADPGFMKKLDRVKSLLSGRHPEGINFQTLFDILMEEYLERHDPVRRSARRKRRSAVRGATGGGESRTGDGRRGKGSRDAPAAHGKGPRRIPKAVRDRVYTRDEGRCTFVGADGRRCGSTWDLEIDHVVPVARGGDDSPGNLRLLCRGHNIEQAEREFGTTLMENHRRREWTTAAGRELTGNHRRRE